MPLVALVKKLAVQMFREYPGKFAPGFFDAVQYTYLLSVTLPPAGGEYHPVSGAVRCRASALLAGWFG